jgi:hypothetical protein
MTTSTINAVPPTCFEASKWAATCDDHIHLNWNIFANILIYILYKKKLYIYTFTYINIYTNTPDITQELPPNIDRFSGQAT